MGCLSGKHAPWWIALGVALLDQASKALVLRAIPPGQSLEVVPGLLDLTLVTNPGGIFGLLRDLDGPLRTLLFSLIPLGVIGMLIVYGWRIPAARVWPRTAIGVILGGALGNLIDRLRLGHVIDFVDAYLGDRHWPAFNVADSAICVGVGLILMDGFGWHDFREPGEEPATGGPPQGSA